jgi:hypothetical protein
MANGDRSQFLGCIEPRRIDVEFWFTALPCRETVVIVNHVLLRGVALEVPCYVPRKMFPLNKFPMVMLFRQKSTGHSTILRLRRRSPPGLFLGPPEGRNFHL